MKLITEADVEMFSAVLSNEGQSFLGIDNPIFGR
jgi:hypothetical protein